MATPYLDPASDEPTHPRSKLQVGSEISMRCTTCGAEVLSGTRFCLACGSPVPTDDAKTEAAQRRTLPPKEALIAEAVRRDPTLADIGPSSVERMQAALATVTAEYQLRADLQSARDYELAQESARLERERSAQRAEEASRAREAAVERERLDQERRREASRLAAARNREAQRVQREQDAAHAEELRTAAAERLAAMSPLRRSILTHKSLVIGLVAAVLLTAIITSVSINSAMANQAAEAKMRVAASVASAAARASASEASARASQAAVQASVAAASASVAAASASAAQSSAEAQTRAESDRLAQERLAKLSAIDAYKMLTVSINGYKQSRGNPRLFQNFQPPAIKSAAATYVEPDDPSGRSMAYFELAVFSPSESYAAYQAAKLPYDDGHGQNGDTPIGEATSINTVDLDLGKGALKYSEKVFLRCDVLVHVLIPPAGNPYSIMAAELQIDKQVSAVAC